MNIHYNPVDLLTKVNLMSDKKMGFFKCYNMTYFGIFQRHLRLHTVVKLLGIKHSIMSTYA